MKRTAPRMRPGKKTRKPADVPDLQTQFEDLLHCVWEAEKNWRFFDRIDRA